MKLFQQYLHSKWFRPQCWNLCQQLWCFATSVAMCQTFLYANPMREWTFGWLVVHRRWSLVLKWRRLVVQPVHRSKLNVNYPVRAPSLECWNHIHSGTETDAMILAMPLFPMCLTALSRERNYEFLISVGQNRQSWTSSEYRFKFEMSKCSILSNTPKNVAFVKLVIEFEANDSDLKWGGWMKISKRWMDSPTSISIYLTVIEVMNALSLVR